MFNRNIKANPHHPKGYFWSCGLRSMKASPLYHLKGEERKNLKMKIRKCLEGLGGYCSTEAEALAELAIANERAGTDKWFYVYECVPL